MTSSLHIRVLCFRSGVIFSPLSRIITHTPHNFSVNLTRNTVTHAALHQIPNVLIVKYHQYFVLANGDQVR